MIDVVVIAGPTASGKTKLSVALAKQFNGEIVNADSMQIYKEMDIGTAKPTPQEMEGVPHHLMGFVDPLNSFSVKEYVELAHKTVQSISASGKLPIVVGGTGMYINSLIDCVAFNDLEPNPEVTARLEETLKLYGPQGLFDELQRIDPELAKQLHPNNQRRVFRALELYYLTGEIPTKIRKEAVGHPSCYRPLMMAADFERETLYERIDYRVRQMLNSGLIDEVKALRNLGCTLDCQSMQGIGYKEVFPYLDDQITFDELYEQICRNTRRYAKRQLTWFRRDQRVLWQKGGFDIEKSVALVNEFLLTSR